MPGPYVRDGHYMYGNALIQPYPAYYNSSWYHRKPPRRFISDLEFHDDGCLYRADQPQDDNAPITRSETMHKVINIETLAFRSLRIKLYAMKEEDDTDIILEIGKQYAVTYMSEGGLKIANGILKIIDQSIPDECVRYVGQFNETVATAWIGMDCSTAGKSDKRKIFIASIRAIEEIPEDDPDYIAPELSTEDLGPADKLNMILNYMPDLNDKLDQILIKVADNDEIMDKLSELDPTEKLSYIISKIDDPTRFNAIMNNITNTGNKVTEDVNAATVETIGIHNTEVMNKFAELLNALGNMNYPDKIDYLYNQFVLPDTEPAAATTMKTIKQKTDEIIVRLLSIESKVE